MALDASDMVLRQAAAAGNGQSHFLSTHRFQRGMQAWDELNRTFRQRTFPAFRPASGVGGAD